MEKHTEYIANLSFDMLPVEGTTPDYPFRMGSDPGVDPASEPDEQPVHTVHLPGFCMGKYPVTQSLWQAVVEADCPPFERLGLAKLDPSPASFKGDQRPVEQVSWNDVQVFLQKLNLLTETQRPPGSRYRLPSEAEWEYAARGGRYGEGYRYAGSDKLSEVGWFEENSEGETHEAGLLMPNELGLFDMSGNVWEWCEDDWHNNYQEAPTDEKAWVNYPERGSNRVIRGGCWQDTARRCRACSRYRGNDASGHPWLSPGFRLVLAPQSVG